MLNPKKLSGHDLLQIAGMDEAGRGPWAGPVVAAAVMMRKKTFKTRGVRDSKLLPRPARERIYESLIRELDYAVGIVDSVMIDQVGILKATNLAYNLALQNLVENCSRRPVFLLIDGRDKFTFPYPYRSIIKGDAKVRLIAAASIIAKVTRDRLMMELDRKYPLYGFATHVGYGTSRHHEALKRHGACKVHRMSYRPLMEFRQ